MTKLMLSRIEDGKPVKVTPDLPALIHCDSCR